MSRLVRKISYHNPNGTHYADGAEIFIYPDGVHLVVRNSDQYPIFGKSLGSETSAKRFLTVNFGKGWQAMTRTDYDYSTGRLVQTFTDLRKGSAKK